MTIIVMLGLTAYFLILLVQTLSKSTFQVISDLQKKNVALDIDRSIMLTKDNFDIAINFLYTGSNETISDHLDEYFNYQLQTIDYEIITDP